MARPKTGTITQLGPAHWRLQVTPSDDPRVGAKPGAKRRVSRSFRGTKTEARAALQRLIVEVGCDLHGGSTATVAELLEQFMATATLAPSTRADWESVISKHLLPELGSLPLWQITARECDALYTDLKARGLGAWRVRCAHVVLHRAMAQAVRWRWIVRNPVSDATRPEVPRTPIAPPETSAVQRVLDYAAAVSPTMACWLHVAVATGARRGEICALRWDDIDFGQPAVRIGRSVSATRRQGIVVKETKTGSVRVVALTRHAVEALREHRQRAASEGVGIERGHFVFTNAGGQPWRPELATRRWERLRAGADLPPIRLHDLRHFVATELLTAGIDVRTVANRLGHARTSTTMDIYWAFVPARDRDAADHLEALLAEPACPGKHPLE